MHTVEPYYNSHLRPKTYIAGYYSEVVFLISSCMDSKCGKDVATES